MKKVKEPDLVNGATLYDQFNYLCSKVDWGKSFLDSTAIQCMNNLFLNLKKDTNKIKS